MATLEIKSIEFKLEEKEVQLFVNGEQAGFLALSSLGGAYQIEEVEIEKQFRGMGFYKQLLIAGLQMKKADMLISNCRNYNSNPIYASWTGNEDLDKDRQVNVYLSGESLCFDIDENE